MYLTQEQIEKINKLAPNEWQENEQGVFNEPSCIPDNVKGLVVYMRWHTGGVRGGSCWDSSNPRPYSTGNSAPKFKVLDLVLKELKPDLTFLQFREIEELIVNTEHTEYEYYGNREEFEIQYIELYKLIEKLESFNNE